MFLFSTPYIFFVGIKNGMKPNCEIKAFLFAELSQYRRQATGKVFSVFAIFEGYICVAKTVFLLLVVWEDELEDSQDTSDDKGSPVVARWASISRQDIGTNGSL